MSGFIDIDLLVNRADALPLYHQIFLALREEIYSGSLPTGSLLPTEHELVERFGVSRITIRRSLKELANHRLVEARRRVGTRVIYRSERPSDMTPAQAVESLLSFVRHTQVQVVGFETIEASAEVAATLNVPAGAAVIHATRIRSLDDEPLGVIESYVPVAIGSALSPAALARTPLLELLRSSGHVFGAGQQYISAVSASRRLASQLHISLNAPIVQVERIIRAQNGVSLVRTVSQFRGDRYRLALDLRSMPRPITT